MIDNSASETVVKDHILDRTGPQASCAMYIVQ